MSKRYKRRSIDSSLFHQRLIKIILIHHLSIVGGCWDKFLVSNGFTMIVPIVNPSLDEPLIKNQSNVSIDTLDSTNRNPLDAGILGNSSPTGFSEKGNSKLKVINPCVPKIEASSIVSINPNVEIPHEEKTKECIDIGFKK
jgi:hypothetical protein